MIEYFPVTVKTVVLKMRTRKAKSLHFTNNENRSYESLTFKVNSIQLGTN